MKYDVMVVLKDRRYWLVGVVAIWLLICGAMAFAQDTLVRDGATCDIPDGYNSAPYSADFNSRGMGEFCVFPAKPWIDGFVKYLDSFTPPDLPECGGLVIGPTIPVYPCYQVVTE